MGGKEGGRDGEQETVNVAEGLDRMREREKAKAVMGCRVKGKGHGAAQSVMAITGQGAGHRVIARNNATEWCGALEAKCSGEDGGQREEGKRDRERGSDGERNSRHREMRRGTGARQGGGERMASQQWERGQRNRGREEAGQRDGEGRGGTGSQRAGDHCGRERDREQDAGLQPIRATEGMTERWDKRRDGDREQEVKPSRVETGNRAKGLREDKVKRVEDGDSEQQDRGQQSVILRNRGRKRRKQRERKAGTRSGTDRYREGKCGN